MFNYVQTLRLGKRHAAVVINEALLLPHNTITDCESSGVTSNAKYSLHNHINDRLRDFLITLFCMRRPFTLSAVIFVLREPSF